MRIKFRNKNKDWIQYRNWSEGNGGCAPDYHFFGKLQTSGYLVKPPFTKWNKNEMEK